MRPVVFFVRGTAEGRSILACKGNPMFDWAIFPTALYVIYRLVKYRRTRDGLILAVVVGVIGPWMMLSRFGLSYYLLPALPVLAVALAHLLQAIGKRWRPLVWCWVLGSVTVFAALYPVLGAVTLSHSTYDGYARLLHLAHP
jgi:dolichyl-phosphate-mannose--protein O-mannosyl transferase